MTPAKAKPKAERTRKKKAEQPTALVPHVIDRGPGRPTALDDEVEVEFLGDERTGPLSPDVLSMEVMTVRDAVLMAIRNGADRKMAFEYCGVPYSTGRSWLDEDGDRQSEEFRTFRTDFRKAENACGLRKVRQVYSDGDPLAWLMRRFRDEWNLEAKPKDEGGDVVPFSDLARRVAAAQEQADRESIEAKGSSTE